jgi:hypothetical protein
VTAVVRIRAILEEIERRLSAKSRRSVTPQTAARASLVELHPILTHLPPIFASKIDPRVTLIPAQCDAGADFPITIFKVLILLVWYGFCITIVDVRKGHLE